MASTVARRAARPTRENRTDSLDAIWRDLQASISDQKTYLVEPDPILENAYAARNLFGVVASLSTRFHNLMALAADSLRQPEDEGRALLRQAFSTIYWAAEIDQADVLKEGFDFRTNEPLLLGRVWLHGLAAREDMHEITAWLTPWLSNSFAGGGAANTARLQNDEHFRNFYRYLASAALQESWPTDIDYSVMGHYGRLLSTIDQPHALRAALPEFCDQRVALSLGFDSMAAPKRRSLSAAPITVLEDAGWESLWPLELFSLRHVYARITGTRISLEADHPLLTTALMRADFSVMPMQDDALVRRARRLAEDVLGPAWRNLQPVAPTP